jgi:isopentenyl-diphosphate Delta-isomerase
MTISQNAVILVNERDEWQGIMDKMQAHKEGLLHRAFSVFILNDRNELLLQQRALHKYHSGGLWSNTCCSHPFPSESTYAGAHRRMLEEMGMSTPLRSVFNLRYRSDVGNGLTENEYDHIYFGQSNEMPIINPDEVMAFQYRSIAEIQAWVQEQPEDFTAWFHLALPRFLEHVKL